MKFLNKLYNSIEWRLNQKIIYNLISAFKTNKFSSISGDRSESDDGNYVRELTKIVSNDEYFRNFKSNRFYRQILEHTTKLQGEGYLEEIKKNSNKLMNEIENFKENDLIGKPNLSFYKDIGSISPTTLRYVKVASDLNKIFNGNIGKNICEIGAGYGGQFFILNKIFKINSYVMFDLPEANLLIEKYLKNFSILAKYETSTLDSFNEESDFDLVISNYAFSEIGRNEQIKYINRVLSKSKRGYLTMNSGKKNSEFKHNHLLLDELEDLLPKFKVLEEKPLIWEDNYIIVWGD